MNNQVRAVLLDADGVVQENPPGWVADLGAFVGAGDAAAFTDDVFGSEKPAMTGERDFRDVLDEVAARWGLSDRVAELAQHWRRIEVSQPVVDLVGRLREAGIRCYLASNQNAYRAAYMQAELGYGEIFDGAFYSCDLRALKSSAEFFEQVLDRLGLPAEDVFFVDDSEEYAQAAVRVGLQAATWTTGDGIDALRERFAARGLPA